MRAFVSAVELLNPHRGTFAKLVGKRNQFADTTAHQNQYVADQERSTRRTVMARSALVSAVMSGLHLAASGRESWPCRGGRGRDVAQATIRAAVTGTTKRPTDIIANKVNTASITVSVHAASSAPR